VKRREIGKKLPWRGPDRDYRDYFCEIIWWNSKENYWLSRLTWFSVDRAIFGRRWQLFQRLSPYPECPLFAISDGRVCEGCGGRIARTYKCFPFARSHERLRLGTLGIVSPKTLVCWADQGSHSVLMFYGYFQSPFSKCGSWHSVFLSTEFTE
jgi:hypothetical protein